MASKDWIVFSDGACSGNPGPGGWGAIVASPDGKIWELGGASPETTNNRMEMIAAIEGLKFVCLEVSKLSPTPKTSVHMISDSSYVLEGFKSRAKRWSETGWKTSAGSDVLNRDLWEEVLKVLQNLRSTGISIRYEQVKGHAGIEGNDRVDQIAVGFSKGQEVELFQGLKSNYSVSLETEPFSLFYMSLVDGNLARHRSWDECSKATSGKKGAKFKKISSKQEEAETLRLWGVTP